MTPGLTFCIGLAMLVLFGWYFATDQGQRKRLLAMTLMLVLVVSSIVTIWPPQKKIALGLDIQGGTSFLIRLKGGDKEVTKAMLDQAVEVIRKRVDYFGGGEPIISRSEEHTSELQSLTNLVCRLLLEKKNSTLSPVNTPMPALRDS